MSALRVIWAIASKDVTLEFRSREVVVAVAAFAVLVIAVFAIALDLTPSLRRSVGPGVLWVGVGFAGVVGIGRSFAQETERDTLDGLITAPVTRDLILIGKALGIFLFMAAALVVIFAVYAALFNAVVFRGEVVLIAFLTLVGFSVIGTLFAAMSTRVRAREVMLPMLFLPVVAPLLMAAIEVTSAAAAGEPWTASGDWLGVALAYDLVFVTAAIVMFPSVLED